MYSDALYEGFTLPKGTSARAYFFDQFAGIVAASRDNTILPKVIEWFYDKAPPPPKDDLTAIWIQRLE